MGNDNSGKHIGLLLVEDDVESGESLRVMLEKRDVSVTLVPSAEEALSRLEHDSLDIVVADIRLEAMNGVDLLRHIRQKDPDFPVILLTGFDSLETAVQAVRLGAQDYILKPLDAIEDLLVPVQNAVRNHRLLLRNRVLEEEREQMKELQIAKETAERSGRLKSEFLSHMSHELRTPLNVVIGYSEMLGDQIHGKLNAKQKQDVEHILASSHYLLRLLTDVLDLSKIEAGKMELLLAEVDVARVLGNSVISIKGRADQHGLSVTLDVPDALSDLTIRADETRLRQIMLNLLSNATKFTPDGGKIMVTARHLSLVNGHWEDGKGRIVDLRVANDQSLMTNDAPQAPMTNDKFLAISVSDTGIGIKREDQDRIFERFQQLDTSCGREHEGTGLGLALAREFVEMHGGSIWVESPSTKLRTGEGEGKGSTFTFIIPIREKG